jgi:hypothetical protein
MIFIDLLIRKGMSHSLLLASTKKVNTWTQIIVKLMSTMILNTMPGSLTFQEIFLMAIKREGNPIIQEPINIMIMTTNKCHFSQQDNGIHLHVATILINEHSIQILYIPIGESSPAEIDIILTRMPQIICLPPNTAMTPIKHMMSFLIDILLESVENCTFNNID